MPPLNPTQNKPLYDVIVIGGGFAGAFTALELVKKGYKVLHIDKDSSILGASSSSFNECYKLHTGVHYLGDLDTATQCLLGSIEFAKEFSEFIEGTPGDPWRKGRHYIMSNSLYDHKEVCDALQKLYEKKVEEDEDNAVFGDPKDFIKYLKKEDYPYVAEKIPYANDGYTIDALYEFIPEDKNIKNNKVYVYLENGLICCKALNKTGQVERMQIDNTDSIGEMKAIKAVLSSGASQELTAKQRELIFEYTSKQNPLFSSTGTIENIYVKTAIETPESQINIQKLRDHLQDELKKHPNYTFLPNSEVKDIAFEESTLNYIIDTESTIVEADGKKTKKMESHISAGVANCAWHKIEELDRKIGYVASDETTVELPDGKEQRIKSDRIIRPKVSLLVALPESLKEVNTCIFSCGPHMSFTNLGDGTAVVTYEPVTNAGSYPAGSVILSEELRDLYKEKLVPESGKGKEFAEKIMRGHPENPGAIKYIPDLAHPDCKVLEVRLGHVKIFVKNGKSFTLNDKDSAIHGRQEDGVEAQGLCYVSHSGMKMTYTKKGAEKVVNLFKDHFYTREKLLERGKKTLKAIPQVLSILRGYFYTQHELVELENKTLPQEVADFKEKKVKKFYNVILYNIFRDFSVATTGEICEKTPPSLKKPSEEMIKEVEKIDAATKIHITEGMEKKSNVVKEINDISNRLSGKPLNSLLSKAGNRGDPPPPRKILSASFN